MALLADPRAKHAAAIAAKRWQETGDDAGLEEDLDAIDEELVTPEPEPPPPPDPDQDPYLREMKALLDEGVPKELLVAVATNAHEDYAAARKRLAEIADSLEGARAEAHKQREARAPRLQMHWRGDWRGDVDYTPGDVVRHGQAVFIAVKASAGLGSEPQMLDRSSGWRSLTSWSAGSTGPRGATGPAGPAGPAGEGSELNLFIQPDAPATSLTTYLWIETEIGVADDFTFWIEDGVA
jgi:hypothetical protein